METHNKQLPPPIPYKLIIISIVVLISLVVYSSRNKDDTEIDDEEVTVSLCQIRAQFDDTDGFDDRTLLSLLATLKMHDFFIGQPVWGPSYTLLYLCEHRLKVGLKQSTLDKELLKVIKHSPVSSGRLAWSCS